MHNCTYKFLNYNKILRKHYSVLLCDDTLFSNKFRDEKKKSKQNWKFQISWHVICSFLEFSQAWKSASKTLNFHERSR